MASHPRCLGRYVSKRMAWLAEGTLSFLISDIEGSTRRWAEDPTMAEALTKHDEVIRSAVERSEGRWVKHTGDGVLAVFGQASKAVEAAVDIQRSIRQSFAGNPMPVRIGIHTGEAEHRGDDVFGLAVSTAARIMDACHGGQVIVSEATNAVLGPSIPHGIGLVDLGSHRLKDLGEPQRLFQVTTPDLDDEFPPPRTLEGANHNLPSQLTSFIGRDEELAEILDLVSDHRLLTLTGVGGAGKTRLSLQAAAELIERFRDGVWFVELASVTDPEAVPVTIAGVLGVQHEKGAAEGVVSRLLDHLRDQQLLLVVDNCEHVLGAAASVIRQILSSASDVSVLASSREGLGIRGERIWQVPSLDVAGDGDESEATRLFMDRARSISSHLQWNDETRPHVFRICELLDGIPLAIELAAARTAVLSPEQIASRLSDRFRLLTGGERSALPRQQTLEAAVDWSYQLLTDTERRLFERLSVFVGGFTLEAAEAVCSDGEVDQGDVLDLLAGLVDKSMVLSDQAPSGVSRYRLLETLRHFGLRRLMDQDQVEPWKQAHLSYYLMVLADTEVLGWDLTANLGWYATEQGNLAAALEWARAESAPEVPLLAAALSIHHLLTLGDPEEALSLIQVGLDTAGLPDSPAPDGFVQRLEALRVRNLEMLGRLKEATAAWQAFQPRLDHAADEDAAWCLVRGASLYTWDPALDVSRAVQLAREALRRSEGLGPEARFSAQMSLGVALTWSGADPREIIPILRSATDMARELEDPERIRYGLSMMVMAAMTLDEREGTDLTSEIEDELLDLWEKSDRTIREEWVVWTAIRRGMWDLADEELDHLEAELRGRHRVQMLMPRAVLRWMRGRLDEAEADFDEVPTHGPIRRWHHDYYPSRAEVAAMRGDRDATEEWVRKHLQVEVEPAEEVMRIAGLRALVMAEVDAGDAEAAVEAVEQMKSMAAEHSGPRVPAVQIGSTEFYIAAAEAEITRRTGPDPGAWSRAEELASWAYWDLYCRVRRLEASAMLGEDVSDEIVSTREEVDSVGFGGLLALLDSFAPPH